MSQRKLPTAAGRLSLPRIEDAMGGIMALAPQVEDASGPLGTAQRAAVEKLSALVGKVVDHGIGPVLDSKAYADSRLARAQTEGRSEADAVDAAIRVIIRESVAAAGTAGFVTGLGGLLAMPVTLPANMAGNLAINARMVGAIAHLRGYPLDDPHTRTVILLTVAGSNLQVAAAGLGVKIGEQIAKESIKAVPVAVLRQINARAGVYLVAKYGTQRSAVTLARAIPVAGGVIGGSVDAALTGLIGKTAKRAFTNESY